VNDLPTPDIPAWIAEQRAHIAVVERRWEGVGTHRMEAALCIIEGLLAQQQPRVLLSAGFSAFLILVEGGPPDATYRYCLRQMGPDAPDTTWHGSQRDALVAEDSFSAATYQVSARIVRPDGTLGPEGWSKPVKLDLLRSCH
jgi:hypothetical protein